MYKLLLSILAVLFLSISAEAQFSKGNLLLGGTLSYISSSQTFVGTEQTNHSGNFNVSLGKATSENSVFGVNLFYGFNNNDQINTKTDLYSIGVFYRKYKTLGKDFYIFGEADAGYNHSSQTGKDNLGNEVSSLSSNGGFIGFSPGIDYKISNKFFLEISIPSLFTASYSSTTTTDKNAFPQTTKGDIFGVTTSLSAGPLDALGIGFRLIL